ncbi:MAG TPA: hypothetical protein DHV83_04635 [Prevotella sp.]|nr:hypothetical protein [Prevotella sp.]
MAAKIEENKKRRQRRFCGRCLLFLLICIMERPHRHLWEMQSVSRWGGLIASGLETVLDKGCAPS